MCARGFTSGIGAKGRVEFTLSEDGKVLSTVKLDGTDPARSLECEITGVTELQIALKDQAALGL